MSKHTPMTDRERAIKAVRRNVPLGKISNCSCFSKPPLRNGCFGVCEDAVAAIIASYEDVRLASAPELAAKVERLEAFAKSILIYELEDSPGLVWLRISSYPAWAVKGAESVMLLTLEQHRRAALGDKK